MARCFLPLAWPRQKLGTGWTFGHQSLDEEEPWGLREALSVSFYPLLMGAVASRPPEAHRLLFLGKNSLVQLLLRRIKDHAWVQKSAFSWVLSCEFIRHKLGQTVVPGSSAATLCHSDIAWEQMTAFGALLTWVQILSVYITNWPWARYWPHWASVTAWK